MKDTRTDPQFKLRYSLGLKEKIEESARANGRTINAEIIHRLESTFTERAVVADPVAQEALLKNVQKLLAVREDDFFRSLEQRLEQTLAPYRVDSATKD